MNELLKDMSSRIKELREIGGKSTAEMARLTEVDERDYIDIESGKKDPPFTFLHKCALAFGIDITALLEGHSAKLSHFQVNRAGQGPVTVKEQGILIRNMAAMFKDRLATPYFVTYDYENDSLTRCEYKNREIDDEEILKIALQRFHLDNCEEFLGVSGKELTSLHEAVTVVKSDISTYEEILLNSFGLDSHIEGRTIVIKN